MAISILLLPNIPHSLTYNYIDPKKRGQRSTGLGHRELTVQGLFGSRKMLPTGPCGSETRG